MKEIINELEVAIHDVIYSTDTDYVGDEYVATLISKASQAIGVMKTLQGFNLKSIMYDMAILAGGAGFVPDSFEEKAKV